MVEAVMFSGVRRGIIWSGVSLFVIIGLLFLAITRPGHRLLISEHKETTGSGTAMQSLSEPETGSIGDTSTTRLGPDDLLPGSQILKKQGAMAARAKKARN